VHSVDRLKTAQRLSDQRPADAPPLQVCIQVNIDGGENKSGVAPHAALALAAQVALLPRLCLRGMMVIPEPSADAAVTARAFDSALQLFNALQAQHASVDTLSMGMSADMQAAIAHGSTMVRVGTAIFGQRA
jgi:PLP dependent protein